MTLRQLYISGNPADGTAATITNTSATNFSVASPNTATWLSAYGVRGGTGLKVVSGNTTTTAIRLLTTAANNQVAFTGVLFTPSSMPAGTYTVLQGFNSSGGTVFRMQFRTDGSFGLYDSVSALKSQFASGTFAYNTQYVYQLNVAVSGAYRLQLSTMAGTVVGNFTGTGGNFGSATINRFDLFPGGSLGNHGWTDIQIDDGNTGLIAPITSTTPVSQTNTDTYAVKSAVVAANSDTYAVSTAQMLSGMSDAFAGSVIDTTKWTLTGNVSTSLGNAVFLPTISSQATLKTVKTYNFVGSSAYIKPVMPTIPAGSGEVVSFMVQSDANNYVSILSTDGTNLTLRQAIAGGVSDTTVAYNSATMAYWRLRGTASQWFWETSPDAVTWTAQRTNALVMNNWTDTYAIISAPILTSGTANPWLVQSYNTTTSSVTQTNNDTFGVKGTVSNTDTDSYVVKSAVLQPNNDVYNIKSVVSAVDNDTYPVKTAVSNTDADTYVVKAVVSSTRNDQYIVKSPVIGTDADTYSVKTGVSTTRSDNYGVRVAVATTDSDSYNVLAAAGTVSQVISDTYTVKAVVSNSNTDTWLTKTAVLNFDSASYAVKTNVATTISNTYGVRTSVTNTDADTYGARSAVINNISTTWVDKAAIINTVNTIWDDRSTTQQAQATLWTTYTSVQVSQATQWGVRAQAAAQRSDTYGVRALAAATLATYWNTLTVALRTNSTTWADKVSVVATISDTYKAGDFGGVVHSVKERYRVYGYFYAYGTASQLAGTNVAVSAGATTSAGKMLNTSTEAVLENTDADTNLSGTASTVDLTTLDRIGA